MGFGWIQTQPHTTKVTFKGSTIFLPSSTKAEAFAILTTLLCCPSRSNITIYTDSANCITTFHKLFDGTTISPRRKLKMNSYLIWLLIEKLVNVKSLNVNLVKVKAHTNDVNNDIADSLAKEGAICQDPIIVNHRYLDSAMGFIVWNNMAILDKNARKWSKIPTQSRRFINFVNNHSLHPLKNAIENNKIDWDATAKWIHHNPFDSPTSNKLSKIQGFRIKSLCFSLPTGDVQKKFYKDLYPQDNIVCSSCTTHIHDNQHIGLCHHLYNNLTTVFAKHKRFLITTLHEHFDTILESEIDIRVQRSPIFSYFDTHTDPQGIHPNHPIYHIIHNFIPTQLSYLFDLFISKKSKYEKVLIKFFHNLQEDIYALIWKPYKETFKKLEKTLNITKRDK